MYTKLLFRFIGSGLFVGYFWWCILNYTNWHFIDFINLIFHEAGHALTIFFPPLITALSGSLLQILVPVTLATYFYTRRELLSMNLLCLWVAQNFANVSVYVRDALPMKLELLGGDSVTHDWNFILGQLGLLRQSSIIADSLLIFSYFIMFVSTAWIIQLLQVQYSESKHENTKI